MAFELVIFEQAKADYQQIVDYLLLIADGPSAAMSFVEEFDRQAGIVSENPEIYALSRIPELAELGYRAMLVNNYIALYYESNGKINVVHVFHQSQDYARFVIGAD